MFCQQCGNNVPEGSAFCPVCGASAQPQAAPAPQAYAAPQGYAAPAPQYAAPAQQPYPQQGYAPVQQPYPQQGYAPAQPGYPQQPYYPAAPAQPSAMSKAFAAFTAVLKGVFSKDVVKTVGNQAKSTGMEWLIGIIISVLTCTPAGMTGSFTVRSDVICTLVLTAPRTSIRLPLTARQLQ